MEIFPNGRIYFDSGNAGSDIDENGLPISTQELYDSAICTINSQTENRNGSYDAGKYPVGSFTIYVDFSRVPKNFSPKVVRIEHEDKGDLGTFTVQRVEKYKLTNTYQLWV